MPAAWACWRHKRFQADTRALDGVGRNLHTAVKRSGSRTTDKPEVIGQITIRNVH